MTLIPNKEKDPSLYYFCVWLVYPMITSIVITAILGILGFGVAAMLWSVNSTMAILAFCLYQIATKDPMNTFPNQTAIQRFVNVVTFKR